MVANSQLDIGQQLVSGKGTTLQCNDEHAPSGIDFNNGADQHDASVGQGGAA
jgi:hypothetical protein